MTKRAPTKLTTLHRVFISPRRESVNYDPIGQSGVMVPSAVDNIGAQYAHPIGYDIRADAFTNFQRPYPVGVVPNSVATAGGAFALDDTQGLLGVAGIIFGFSPSGFTPVVVGGDNVDGVAPATNGRLFDDARLYLFNGASFDRWRSAGDNADALAVSSLGDARTLAINYFFNGTTFDRGRSASNASDAQATTALGVQQTNAFNYAFNGTTFDRLRSASNASDALATTAQGVLSSQAFNYGFNGASFDRLRSGGNNADAVATSSLGVLAQQSFSYGFNGTTWDRLRSQGNNASGVATSTLGLLGTAAYLYVFNGATWDRWNGTSGSGTVSVVGTTADNIDAVAVTTNAALRTTGENYGFNGTSWDRIRSQGNNADGVATLSLGVLATASFTYGFNGATWDRIASTNLADGTAPPNNNLNVASRNTLYFAATNTWNVWRHQNPDADGVSPSTVGTAGVAANLESYNGATWDRVRSQGNNADGVAVGSTGVLKNAAFLYGFNTVSWDRINSSNLADGTPPPNVNLNVASRNTLYVQASNTWNVWRHQNPDADAVSPSTAGTAGVAANLIAYSGVAWDRIRNSSATNQALVTNQSKALQTADAANWGINNNPGLNTQATTTRAAGIGSTRHVCTLISASLRSTAAVAAIGTLVLRDGASGAGTILWQQELDISVVGTINVNISGLSLIGSAATAMTLEFTAASGATSAQVVSMAGYTTQ